MGKNNDDVALMSKKELEREVRKLRGDVALLKHGIAALAQSNTTNSVVIKDSIQDDARAEGWNKAVDLFSEYYEPLMQLAWEIESQIGALKAYVISATRVNRLTEIKPLIEQYAKSIAVLLGQADPYNRAMAAPFDDLELWVDFSSVWTLYTAALDYVNKGDSDPQHANKLIELSRREGASLQFIYDLTESLIPRRNRDRTQIRRDRALLVKTFVDKGKGVTNAALSAMAQWNDEHPNDNYSYSTFQSDYYTIYGPKKRRRKIELS